MTKVFAVDVKVWATAYIKAETPEEALIKLGHLRNEALELPTTDWADNEEEPVGVLGPRVSARRFDDPDLPEVSLAPTMTIDGEHIDSVAPDEFEERE